MPIVRERPYVAGLLAGFLLGAALCLGVPVASADSPQFADWTDIPSATTATGTLLGASISLSGSHVFPTPISRLDGTWTFFDGPDFTPPLAKTDLIQIGGLPGDSYTLQFGAPVKDPVLEIGSLADKIGFPAGTQITKLSGQDSFTVANNVVTGTLICSRARRRQRLQRNGPTDRHLHVDPVHGRPDLRPGLRGRDPGSGRCVSRSAAASDCHLGAAGEPPGGRQADDPACPAERTGTEAAVDRRRQIACGAGGGNVPALPASARTDAGHRPRRLTVGADRTCLESDASARHRFREYLERESRALSEGPRGCSPPAHQRS